MVDVLSQEVGQAAATQNDPLLFAFSGELGDVRAPARFVEELCAAALAPVVGRLEVILEGRHAHVGVRHQAPGLVLDSLAKEDASPQHLEAGLSGITCGTDHDQAT